jgi:hypothetical protein
MERWRIVKDYPNYMVSDLGRVKNIVTGRLLKPTANKQGYVKINLHNSSRRKIWSIHLLIAEAFLGHETDGTHKIVVDHINNDKLDNRLENLQLITNRENCSKDRNRELPSGIYQRSSGRYCVRLKIGNKRPYFGTFDTPEAASTAYQEALSNL